MRPRLAALLVFAAVTAACGSPGPAPSRSGPGASPPSGGAPGETVNGGGTGDPGGPTSPATGTPGAGVPGGASPGGSDGSTALADHALAMLTTDEDLVGQSLMLGWTGTSARSARDVMERLRPGAMVVVANARTAAAATEINLGLVALADELGLQPILKAVDHEGGPVQRIADVPNLGSNRAFASTEPSEEAACHRGRGHAGDLLAMGFDMNLAPVLDVDSNPASPVIGKRSYGSSPRVVARLGTAYIRGIQSGGIAAVGKHFPGHGDTAVDSHVDLPVLDVGRRRLEQLELVPFVRATRPETGVAAIMTAHIALPRIDASGVPATLSRPVVTGLLRERLGYDGLVLSDDMGAMRAITDRFAPDQAAVAALDAGVDMLIIVGDAERQAAARDGLLSALADGRLSRDRVREAARRVLLVKARFGLLGGAATPSPGC